MGSHARGSLQDRVWAEVLVGGASRKKRLSHLAHSEAANDASTRWAQRVPEGGWEMTV